MWCAILQMLILFPLLPPQSYYFHIHNNKEKIPCCKDLGSRIFFFINCQCILVHVCNPTVFVQRRMITSGVLFLNFWWAILLVCHHTPQDRRLIIVCSPFVTRSVLLILSLSASLGVSDNLLRRKPLTCSVSRKSSVQKSLLITLRVQINCTEGSVWVRACILDE